MFSSGNLSRALGGSCPVMQVTINNRSRDCSPIVIVMNAAETCATWLNGMADVRIGTRSRAAASCGDASLG